MKPGVLFICMGKSCRSTMAEALAEKRQELMSTFEAIMEKTSVMKDFYELRLPTGP